MTFIDAVNRILRINGLIRGDTDILAAFTDTAHNATSSIAQIAIQAELAELISRELLPYQKVVNATITMQTGVRTYALPANYSALYGTPAYFFDTVNNTHIFEYPGGEDKLRDDVYTYRTDTGYPNWFYFEQATTKEVSFYQVPNAANNNLVLSYDYTADTNVVNSTDVLPLQSTNEAYAFCETAGRRFKFMYEGKPETDVSRDPMYMQARATLFNLIRRTPTASSYGKIYR